MLRVKSAWSWSVVEAELCAQQLMLMQPSLDQQ
jgi:hypothetical protein